MSVRPLIPPFIPAAISTTIRAGASRHHVGSIRGPHKTPRYSYITKIWYEGFQEGPCLVPHYEKIRETLRKPMINIAFRHEGGAGLWHFYTLSRRHFLSAMRVIYFINHTFVLRGNLSQERHDTVRYLWDMLGRYTEGKCVERKWGVLAFCFVFSIQDLYGDLFIYMVIYGDLYGYLW